MHHFDGCMYGLASVQTSTKGRPLKKPWTIASTSIEFSGLRRRCDGSHDHVITAGADTKHTEGYTDALADVIHDCWTRQCNAQRTHGDSTNTPASP